MMHGGWHGRGGGPWGGPGSLNEPPARIREAVDRLLGAEPDSSGVRVPFSQGDYDPRPYNLRRLLAPRRGAVLGALLLVIVETALINAGPWLTSVGIDNGIVPRNTKVLILAAAAYVATLIVGGLATGLRTAWTGRLAAWLNYDQRVRIFSHLQRLGLDFFTEEKAGRLMSRMTSDIESTSQMLQNGIVQLFVQALTLVFVTGLLFSLNVRLAAVTLLAVVPALSILTWWFRGASERAYEKVRDTIATLIADLAENLSGIAVVIAHNRTLRNLVRHRELAAEYRDANVTASRLGSFYGGASALVGVLAQVAVLAVGGHMVLAHELTIGRLTAFVLYLTSFFAPIQQMAQLYNTYQQGQAAIGKIASLLAVPPSVTEPAGAHDLPAIRGEIVFDDLTFGYLPEQPVLRDVTLHIAPGETVSVVGPTGAGKSTLAKLVTRFYDPIEGRVTIDGHDLRDVTMSSLRRQLGVVPQEPFLFGGTIRDNLLFGNPSATDAQIWEAARSVGLDGMLERLPAGLDTEVLERGASLSSGERQLLAIGRAFLARPRVIVLDEATSNLDLASEARVERALDVLLEGRTAIVIAHRLSTAMRADRIAVVDGGVIAEVGTHDELVAGGGIYASMYETWISHQEPTEAIA